MLEFLNRRGKRNCEGMNRRAFLSIGSLSAFGLTLPRLLQAASSRKGRAAPAKSCILLWLDGGLSTIDTFDMKPNAPEAYRGEFRPIATNVLGSRVCEHLPHVARKMDKICQLRTVVHSGSQHAEACHFMLTGWPQVPDPSANPVGSTVHPCYGSVVSEQQGWRAGMPPFVQLCGGIKYHHAGYLGSAYNSLRIDTDPNRPDFRVENVSIPDSGRTRLSRRRSMLSAVDDLQQLTGTHGGEVVDRNEFYRQAYELITSKAARSAFRIDQESSHVRDCYGRNMEGQATLLARRLVEAGVRFITVQFNGYDTHDLNFVELRRDLLPKLDKAYSALLTDLDQRGMLDETLVICMGEFGRTPRVNGAAGRDHYPKVNNINFSGAGVPMGEVIGRTDHLCSNVVGNKHSTHDLAATIYHLLGVDHAKEYRTKDNRPILTTNNGRPIREIVA